MSATHPQRHPSMEQQATSVPQEPTVLPALLPLCHAMMVSVKFRFFSVGVGGGGTMTNVTIVAYSKPKLGFDIVLTSYNRYIWSTKKGEGMTKTKQR